MLVGRPTCVTGHLSCLPIFSHLFTQHRQQDAHELLVALLDRLQCEVLAAQVWKCGVGRGRITLVLSAAWTCEWGDSTEVVSMARNPPLPHFTLWPHGIGPSSLPAALDQYLPLHLINTCLCAQTSAAGLRETQRTVPQSRVLCPGARAFNGCLQHTLTCSKCSHVTKVCTIGVYS